MSKKPISTNYVNGKIVSQDYFRDPQIQANVEGAPILMRDVEIKRAQEQAKVNDTLILQKINASHRVAFAEKFPGQVEHILRLLTERLQSGLDKRDGVELDNPDTWKMTCKELADLSTAIHHIYIVKEKLKDVQSNS